MRHNKATHRQMTLVLIGIVVVVLTGWLGARLLNLSFAATSYSHSPEGYIDSCALETGGTALYGWGHDPDATTPGNAPQVSVTISGGTTQVLTRNTGIANYRDVGINNYIHTHYPGQPTSSVYGFKTVFAGLYKGTTYVPGGTVLNIGSGSNAVIGVNTKHSVDGAGQPYFEYGKIPDICLTAAPLPPPPPPPPTPKPPPPKPAPGPIKRRAPTPGSPAPSPSPPTLSSDATADITAGTTQATLVVPAGNAAKIRLIYGTDPQTLNQANDDTPVSGDSASLRLTKLQASTVYSYAIVRTAADDSSVTSSTATFTTTGYDIVVAFVAGSKPISGIKAELKGLNLKATSDKDGHANFHNVPLNSYKVAFTYRGQKHEQAVDTAGGNPAQVGPNGLTDQLLYSINLDRLATANSPKTPHRSVLTIIVPLLLVLIMIGAAFWFWRRRQARNNSTGSYDIPPLMPLPPVQPITPTPLPAQPKAVHHHKTPPKTHPGPPPPPHMGESLRDMVIKAMAEETKRRKQQ